jgi:hypothetical protein
MSTTQSKGGRNGTAPPGMIVPRHGGGLLKPIKKGEARNPGGKGGLWQETQRYCREKSPEAAQKLHELMSSDDERVALMAADKLMTWARGKPPDYDPATDRSPPRFDLSKLTQGLINEMLPKGDCSQLCNRLQAMLTGRLLTIFLGVRS